MYTYETNTTIKIVKSIHQNFLKTLYNPFLPPYPWPMKLLIYFLLLQIKVYGRQNFKITSNDPHCLYNPPFFECEENV